ncbi:ExbD/TolR family protein [Terrimonas alba]|uniref:ExbD/TolR family protein n=1 Tax=Terrimonas alba TaxID=3349636 RepID=UPI0035F29656
MAEINSTTNDRRRPGFRARKHTPKTDMTPMVDLGFLLISFFVITTELSKPMVTNLAMPKEGPPVDLGESDALTVLVSKSNTLFYYHGDWNKAAEAKAILKTGFSPNAGIGDVIRQKQKWLDVHNKRDGRKGLMLLIKPGPDADYGNVVDMIDQALINNVEKYAVLKSQPEESQYLAKEEF